MTARKRSLARAPALFLERLEDRCLPDAGLGGSLAHLLIEPNPPTLFAFAAELQQAPAEPSVLAETDGHYLYVALPDQRQLVILDVSSPSELRILSRATLDGRPVAAIATWGFVTTFDVSNRAAPDLLPDSPGPGEQDLLINGLVYAITPTTVSVHPPGHADHVLARVSLTDATSVCMAVGVAKADFTAATSFGPCDAAPAPHDGDIRPAPPPPPPVAALPSSGFTEQMPWYSLADHGLTAPAGHLATVSAARPQPSATATPTLLVPATFFAVSPSPAASLAVPAAAVAPTYPAAPSPGIALLPRGVAATPTATGHESGRSLDIAGPAPTREKDKPSQVQGSYRLPLGDVGDRSELNGRIGTASAPLANPPAVADTVRAEVTFVGVSSATSPVPVPVSTSNAAEAPKPKGRNSLLAKVTRTVLGVATAWVLSHGLHADRSRGNSNAEKKMSRR